MFWAIAKSTYIEQYEKNLQKLAEKCLKGFDAISELQGNFWVRAYFETDSMCDIVDNNLSEVFNAWILEARCKSIISMLEDISHMVMNRLKTKRAVVSSWDGEIAPRIRKILIESFEEGTTWTAEGNGRDEYEISNKDERRFVVNISMRNCTCRKWQLTGIPCCHAICAMHCCRINYEDGVAHWYKRDTYLKAYAYSVDCIKGPETWKLYKGLKLEPPPFRKSKGRPRVKRIKPAHETKIVKKGEVETLSRKGIKMTCSICGLQGHNKRGCLHKDDPNFKKLEPKKLEKKKKSNDAPSEPRIVFNVRDAFCAPQATEGTKKNGKKDSGKIKQKRQKKSNQNLQGEPSSSLHGQHSSQTTECLTQGSQNF